MGIREFYERADRRITDWMAKFGVLLLRMSLGVVFFWFGSLKFFPGLSPAQGLATRTIEVITFGALTPDVSIYVLAAWESIIGLGLILGVFMRAVLLLLFIQMVGTFMPVFIFPGEIFISFPYALTLEGQYIIKNLVLMSAAIVIGATVRGGAVVAEPEIAELEKNRRERD